MSLSLFRRDWFLQNTKYYRRMKKGAVALYVPSESRPENGELIDVVAGNNATVTGSYVNTAYTVHDKVEQTMFKGDGARYVTIPTAIGLDEERFSVVIDCILPNYATDGLLFEARVDANNYFWVWHSGSGQISVSINQSGIYKAMPVNNVPENERITILATVNSAAVETRVFHSAGFESDSDTVTGAIVGSFTAIASGANTSGANPIQDGTFIGLVPLYNTVLTEAQGQAIYDDLYANNGILAPKVLPTLSPSLERTGTLAQWQNRTTGLDAFNLGVSDLLITLRANGTPASLIRVFARL